MTEFAGYIEKSGVKICQERIENMVVPELIPDGYERNKLDTDIGRGKIFVTSNYCCRIMAMKRRKNVWNSLLKNSVRII